MRRGGLLFGLLIAATLLAHLAALWRMRDWLDAGLQASRAPQRMQAAFVREIQPAAPPAPASPAVTPAPKKPPPRAAKPAEAPPPPASAPEPPPPAPPETLAQAPAEPASAPGPAAASEAASTAAAAASPPAAPAFDWPLGTRLSYVLTGSIRGEVHGTAQVEWLREGARYQVHLDVTVGPGFAPLMQRRMTSDGTIGPAGLAPERYDERTQIAFGSAREATIRFEPDAITLANGKRVPSLAGAQDAASQFVQLTYLFSIETEPLRAGRRFVVPLALPRRFDPWVYEVIGEEPLATPFGTVRTWHLKPQREGDAAALAAEAWFAPSLRWLPVRIVIRQGKDDHIDLLVDRLPQEAIEERAQGGGSGR
ncbi:MAG TPA: DUF3108 domain-containing protein [Methylibium sp.]|uniref:DUF3108 domain-containing protein n=1 Tax=Methylibium sp. TaxID=2067992 RepID=UPI002DB97980|nr:DUF3108 domain-containing protein [Methylibium sp.]HEU4460750.1 DUF3108 domain-containing protein [Methylibium sp.]